MPAPWSVADLPAPGHGSCGEARPGCSPAMSRRRIDLRDGRTGPGPGGRSGFDVGRVESSANREVSASRPGTWRLVAPSAHRRGGASARPQLVGAPSELMAGASGGVGRLEARTGGSGGDHLGRPGADRAWCPLGDLPGDAWPPRPHAAGPRDAGTVPAHQQWVGPRGGGVSDHHRGLEFAGLERDLAEKVSAAACAH